MPCHAMLCVYVLRCVSCWFNNVPCSTFNYLLVSQNKLINRYPRSFRQLDHLLVDDRVLLVDAEEKVQRREEPVEVVRLGDLQRDSV